MSNEHIISIDVFERIFRTIHTSLRRNHFLNLHASCSFFSVIGAAILNSVHGIKAHSVSGAAAFRFGSHSCLLLADKNISKGFRYSNNGFHSWIETSEWFIDFTSPLVPEITAKTSAYTKNRRMLQKRLSEQASSPFKLSKDNCFYLHADPQFTKERVNMVIDDDFYFGIVQECISDYQSDKKFSEHDLPISGSW